MIPEQFVPGSLTSVVGSGTVRPTITNKWEAFWKRGLGPPPPPKPSVDSGGIHLCTFPIIFRGMGNDRTVLYTQSRPYITQMELTTLIEG